MLGSTFIFNPILWIILLTITFFGSFFPKDQTFVVPAQAYYGSPLENTYETLNWDYDNVDDDIFTVKKHYKLGTDLYVFQATHADIPKNQKQDVVFTDEKGNKIIAYMSYDPAEDEIFMTLPGDRWYSYTYVCKTTYPDKTGYWEPDPTTKNTAFLYLPLEKRRGAEVPFTILAYGSAHGPDSQRPTYFTYYVTGENGKPKAVDRINISYQNERENFTLTDEHHGFD